MLWTYDTWILFLLIIFENYFDFIYIFIMIHLIFYKFMNIFVYDTWTSVFKSWTFILKYKDSVERKCIFYIC
jgi:hypothetical protein